MIQFGLYLTFGLFCVAALSAIFSSVYSVVKSKNKKSILTILLGLIFVFPCIALLFFPMNQDLVSKFCAAGLISALTLIVIAVLAIIGVSVFNLLKK